MRCKNCGWPNRPGERVCVKCNSPLELDEGYETPMNATVAEVGQYDEDDSSSEINVCPKCGFHLQPNAEKCPNCNYQFGVQFPRVAPKSKNHPTRMENPAEANKVSGTLNPYMYGADPEPTIILTPLKRLNEKKELPQLEYEGKEIVLTRSNTEPDNSSITSQNQAVITNVDGAWFIEDKSEQGTTFVRAKNKIELHDGSIILLGNRLFEFHVSKD